MADRRRRGLGPLVGLVDAHPALAARVAKARPDAELVRLSRARLVRGQVPDVDVVVVAGDTDLLGLLNLEELGDRLVVVGTMSAGSEARNLHPPVVERPTSIGDLQLAIDTVLGVPRWQRTLRNLRTEEDDTAMLDRVAFGARALVGLYTLAWMLTWLRLLDTADWIQPWVPVLLVMWLVGRALWWRLQPVLVLLDVVVVGVVAVAASIMAGTLTAVSILLPVVVFVQLGWTLPPRRAASVFLAAVILGSLGVLVLSPGPGTPSVEAVTPLLSYALAIMAGSLGARLSNRPGAQGRRFELERFRESLYELAERQASVSVSFDHGAAAQQVLDDLMSRLHPTAAVILVTDGTGPLAVAAAHNLAAPAPARLAWQPGGPRDDGADPSKREPHVQVADVLDQLQGCLPPGEVVTLPAVVDGELVGGVVVVGGPADVADDPEFHALVDEAALAFDSVRLFGRLRAHALDQERARIARSLHDGVMQTLSHVGMQLDLAVVDDEVVATPGDLAALRDHVLTSLAEMRNVVNDLRTASLDRGLAHALESLSVALAPAAGPLVTVEAVDVPGLEADVEEQLLRIAQEAVSNAIRHARATRVRVSLRRRDEWVVLQIQDDGVGFAHGGARDGGGVGLTSIRQRVEAIGARLDVDTGPGAIVTVLCPWNPRLQVGTSSDESPAPASPAGRDASTQAGDHGRGATTTPSRTRQTIP